MTKKQLTEKQVKKLIKKLKDAKKKKRKQKKDALISQKVTQKIVIGSNVKDKTETNAGRSFPIVQFLPQPQTQNGDTQLLRDLLLRNNLSPLTRTIVSKVPYKPSYDLGDQAGLEYNYNPYNSGNIGSQPQDNQDNQDNQSDISSLSENGTDFNSMFVNDSDANSVLQPPPEKQGTLDIPIPEPKPNLLAQPKITEYFQPQENPPEAVKQYIGKKIEDIQNEEEEQREKQRKKQMMKDYKNMLKELPPQQNKPFIDPEEYDIKLKKTKGRPPGSKNIKKTKAEEKEEEDV